MKVLPLPLDLPVGICGTLHAAPCLVLDGLAMTVVCKHGGETSPMVDASNILPSNSRLCEYGGVLGVDTFWFGVRKRQPR